MRCTMPSRPRCSNGPGMACPPIPGRGSFRPAASKRSTPSAAAPGSTHYWGSSPSSSTPTPVPPRADLSGEAIRLGRLLVVLLPEPEAVGLLALMLLHESRRAARTSPAGDLILLDDQDRSLWNRDQIAEGVALVERALSSRRF